MIWSKIRKGLDAKKAEKFVKIYQLCRAEEDDHWNLLKLFTLFPFFKSFKIRCCLFCVITKKLQLAVQVPCLFYFYFVDFLKKSGFIFFKWVVFWVVFFTTTLFVFRLDHV